LLANLDGPVQQLMEKATAEFAAGSADEARRLTVRLQELAGGYQVADRRARARLRTLESLRDQMENRLQLARQVTVGRYLWPFAASMVPPDILAAPLPNIEAALEATEVEVKGKSHILGGTAEPVRPRSPAATTTPERPARTAAPTARRSARVSAPPATAPSPAPPPQSQAHLVILELSIQFAYGVARMDGPISDPERRVIDAGIVQHFRYDASLHQHAQALCARYENGAIDFNLCVLRITQQFTPEHRRALLDLAQRINEASSTNSASGTAFLQKIARGLDVPLPAPQR
jgi:hypothetical protein